MANFFCKPILKSRLLVGLPLSIFNESIFWKNRIFFSQHQCQPNFVSLLECSGQSALEIAQDDFKIIENFISKDEENFMLLDIEPKWRRLKYQTAHWDNAIQNYRETENVSWSKESNSVIAKMKSAAFGNEDVQKSAVHVLDLSLDGFILPHVDSIKFCGRVICGLSLLSPCVMKFVNTDNSSIWFKALLSRRSLYIMQDRVRYNFTHEVLKNSASYFQNKHIDKGRRISVLSRSEPQLKQETEPSNTIFTSKVISLD